MKAIVHRKYGDPANLKLEEVKKPVPRPKEVLIKVKATAINSWDADWVRGQPYVYRILFGFFSPRIKILGCDVAGIIEEVGSDVKTLKKGDEVFGDLSESGWGGLAEYTTAKEGILSIKPPELSFEEAAALPQAGVLALQGLRFNGPVKPGSKILFNGAGGGVGTLGIQLAKYWGAHVTAVDALEKQELLKSLGADETVNYQEYDYTTLGKSYDLIVDVIAMHSSKSFRKILNENGALGIIGGKPGVMLGVAVSSMFRSKNDTKKLSIVAHKPNIAEQDELAKYVVDGILKPVIDNIYPLSKTEEAIRCVMDGKVMGKVVVKI
jgi:NADPH:quinone reductase-like Zn-dependent oxidoreductase